MFAKGGAAPPALAVMVGVAPKAKLPKSLKAVVIGGAEPAATSTS